MIGQDIVTSLRYWEQWFNESVQEPRQEFKIEAMEDTKKSSFLTMMRHMLAFRPEERLAASEVMEFQ